MLTHRDASHVFGDHAGGARPVASDRALPMVARTSRLLAAIIHLAGSRPHASGRALPWLRPTVGRTICAAAVFPTSASVLKRRAHTHGSAEQAVVGNSLVSF